METLTLYYHLSVEQHNNAYNRFCLYLILGPHPYLHLVYLFFFFSISFIDCVWVSVITSVSTDYFHPPQTLVQELPTCLPSTYKGRARKERKLVFLRDSAMRLWPVLYHERSGFKILTNGWKSFRKANNIQPGDECVFGVESDLDGVYGVHIARR
jgi:hypothetical protein